MKRTCYRCEQEVIIPSDARRIEEGHGRFSIVVQGRCHSFSNKKICLGEDTDIFDTSLVDIAAESKAEIDQPIALEDAVAEIEGSL
jgi:uncharacterized Fe-S cluster-containing protein